MNKLVLLILGFLFINSLNSQSVLGRCGVTIAQQDMYTDALKQNIEESGKYLDIRNNAVVYVPVKVHIVTLDDGTGGVGKHSILFWLCKLNTNYKPLNIQFYLKGEFHNIADSKIYNDPMSSAQASKLVTNKDNKALNLFITGKSGEDGVLGFYQPNGDYVVLPKSEINSFTHTGSHEFGHFFSLRHTFYGWEGCPYFDSNISNPMVQTYVPCSGEFIEWANRSNCKTSADLICDTPPDYNFGFGWPNCKPFDKIIIDKNLDTVRPMQNNYMGYFFDCGDYLFTANQSAIMLADYNSSRRAFLRGTPYTPPSETVGQDFTPVYPINGQAVLNTAAITIDWQPVQGATRYFLEYSITPTFNERVTIFVETKTNSYTIPANTLRDAKTYYYRITPFNDYATCTAKLENAAASFYSTSSLAVKGIDIISAWDISPTVVGQGNNLNSMLIATKTFQGRETILNAYGVPVRSTEVRDFTAGVNNWQIDTRDIKPGAYFVCLQSVNGMVTKKILIQ
jgi:hypothetical protein